MSHIIDVCTADGLDDSETGDFAPDAILKAKEQLPMLIEKLIEIACSPDLLPQVRESMEKLLLQMLKIMITASLGPDGSAMRPLVTHACAVTLEGALCLVKKTWSS
eukprot:GABV01006600.1.p2 GENE.GABV01006600.1~~GABV01006600.1.p2  ORF type:complete len:106 (+),score=42.32 GABV01006600.1:63-380(+)